MKELKKLESDEFLLKTFQVDLYMVLVLTFAVIAAVYFFMFRRYSYVEWFWLTFAGFFNQHKVVTNRRRNSFMILNICWWFFAFITICFYQAKMKYFLTVPLEKGIEFCTMDELLSKLEFGKWTAYQVDNGYKPSMYCKPEQCRKIQALERSGR